jgi:hypothetical protein
MIQLALVLLLALAGATTAHAYAEVLAVARTHNLSNVVHIPASGFGAFAVAAVATVRDRGPVKVDAGGCLICQSDPATGACLAAPTTGAVEVSMRVGVPVPSPHIAVYFTWLQIFSMAPDIDVTDTAVAIRVLLVRVIHMAAVLITARSA